MAEELAKFPPNAENGKNLDSYATTPAPTATPERHLTATKTAPKISKMKDSSADRPNMVEEEVILGNLEMVSTTKECTADVKKIKEKEIVKNQVSLFTPNAKPAFMLLAAASADQLFPIAKALD